MSRRAAYERALIAFLRHQSKLRLLVGMRGNIGDHMIWAGTRDILDAGALQWTPVSLAEAATGDHAGETLVIPGSGAFVESWHEWLPALVLAASRVFHRVIVLPSQYDTTIPVVAECVSRPNVIPMSREPRSYRRVKRLSAGGLGFDPALSARVLSECAESGARGHGALLALRDDGAGILARCGLGSEPAWNRDISRDAADLNEWLQAIVSADTVVTDRLHVAVAAVVLGRRLRYIDPYDGKISTYLAYVFRELPHDLVAACSCAWLHEYSPAQLSGRVA